MTTHDPYTPPEAAFPAAPALPSKMPVYIVAGLVAVQLYETFHYLWAFYELTRVGAVRPLGVILGLPASICLYTAALRSLRNPSRCKRLYLAATIGLGLAAPVFWGKSVLGGPYPWFTTIASGAVLGLAGWWFVRRFPDRRRPIQELA